MMRFIHLIAFVFFSAFVYAQSISLPPSGDNQKCSITQWIGLASITITYNSPDVTGPNGEERRGKIWGGVVPYGLSANNFGTAKEMPWRAGANENTTINFSHDVNVEGRNIKSGTYGLHMIPGKDKWIIIFNKNYSAWGSYFYDESDDVLRVEAAPAKCSYVEWLTYDFIERKPTYAVACLKWEELMIPFKIEVDAINIYLTKIRQELQGSHGFAWQNWLGAVNFCIQNNVNLEEAMLWIDYAINAPFIGDSNFETLSTKAILCLRVGKTGLANELFLELLQQPTASISNIDNLGRKLIGMGEAEEALKIFEMNHEKHPDDNFTTLVGLAIGNEAAGKIKKAIKYYEIAAENAPEGQKEYYLRLAANLEK